MDISIKYTQFEQPEEFCPLREPGPHIPSGCDVNALSLPTDVLVLKTSLKSLMVEAITFRNQIPQLCTPVGVISEFSW